MSEAIASPHQLPEGAPTQETELTPEQQRAREIMVDLAQAMHNRTEITGPFSQSRWRSNQGAQMHYDLLQVGEETSYTLKIHGAGGTFTASEYTLTNFNSQEILRVQHPSRDNVPTAEMNDVDVKFLEYVQAAMYDPESELTRNQLQKLEGN